MHYLAFAQVRPQPLPKTELYTGHCFIIHLLADGHCPLVKEQIGFIEISTSGGGGVLGSSFAGFVPLASQNPYPIIVYSVASCRPHLSHFWANVIVISTTEFNASRLLNIETTAGTTFQPRIFLFLNPCYQNFLIPKISKICDPILVTLLQK